MGTTSPQWPAELEQTAPQSRMPLLRPEGKVLVLLLGATVCWAALGLHTLSLCQPVLYMDDFDILLKSWTWADLCTNLWAPVNEHSWPLTRLSAWLLLQIAGWPTTLPLAAALQMRFGLVAGMWLAYLFVRRELGHPYYGLMAMTIFGVSATYQQTLAWFATTPNLLALDMTLLTLLAAQRWRQTGRGRHLVLSVFWAALAPAWFASGIIAGLLGCLYLFLPGPKLAAGPSNPRPRRWTCLVPLLGSLAFLSVSLPYTGQQILHSEHYGSKNAVQAFDVTMAFVNTGRSLVDNVALGSLGIAAVTCPVGVAVFGLILLTVAGVWWWRRAPARGLVVLGLGFILANYLLIYGARADWPYEPQLRHWSRYNVFPQLGVALIVCAGLPRWQDGMRRRDQPGHFSKDRIRTLTRWILVLFVLQLPRGLIGTPMPDPRQPEVLRQVEDMDARCRAYHITSETARRVLEPLPMPNGGEGAGGNAWSLLRGSDDPHPLSDAEARRLLQP